MLLYYVYITKQLSNATMNTSIIPIPDILLVYRILKCYRVMGQVITIHNKGVSVLDKKKFTQILGVVMLVIMLILTFNYNSSTSSLLLICSAIMYVIKIYIFEKS